MKVRKPVVIAVLLTMLLASLGASAQVKGIPVDIPGTNVNFFLYRYEGEQAPYSEINEIWSNLTDVFEQWVMDGQKPEDLSSDDVTIRTENGEVGIYLKESLILIVDEYHAQANKATRQQLADKWAENLKLGVDHFVTINEIK